MSEIKSLSTAARDLAALEIKLNSGDLTLDEIRDIGEEITLKTTKKTADLATSLFDRLEVKKGKFLDRQVTLVEDVHEFSKNVSLLALQWNGFTPDEISEKLVSLKTKVSTFPSGELPEGVRKVRDQALDLLESLRFQQVFPLAQELDLDSLEANFATRMKKIADRMREQNSHQPFAELSPLQQREIFQTTREGT